MFVLLCVQSHLNYKEHIFIWLKPYGTQDKTVELGKRNKC